MAAYADVSEQDPLPGVHRDDAGGQREGVQVQRRREAAGAGAIRQGPRRLPGQDRLGLQGPRAQVRGQEEKAARDPQRLQRDRGRRQARGAARRQRAYTGARANRAPLADGCGVGRRCSTRTCWSWSCGRRSRTTRSSRASSRSTTSSSPPSSTRSSPTSAPSCATSRTTSSTRPSRY